MMTQGTWMVGTCVGVTQEPWKNGQGMNYRLGLSRTMIGHYGEETIVTESIDINKDDYQRIAQQAAALKGRDVYVQVVCDVGTGGRNGGWLKRYAPKGSNLFPFNAEAFAVKNAVVREAKAG